MNQVSFPTSGVDRIAGMEAWHFWFAGRRALIRRMLARYRADQMKVIADIGCGTGYTTWQLHQDGYPVIGLDYYLEGIASQASSPLFCIQADATTLPFASGSLDAVLLLDVLEHTDDHLLLTEIHRVLKPDGLIFISVPAFQFLWSSRDVLAGHFRRYTAYSLEQVLQQSGFSTLQTRYYQFWLMPLVVVSRWIGRNRPAMRDREERPNGVLNRLLTWINLTEIRLGSLIRWPWGTSLIGVGKRE